MTEPAAATAIVWFRRDLRLSDNAALRAAAAGGRPVLPVYVHDFAFDGDWPAGAASRWWLHHSLAALDRELNAHGLRLLLLRGPATHALLALCEASGASSVHWNRLYEPAAIIHDDAVRRALRTRGVRPHDHAGHLLHEPWAVRTRSGTSYRKFTPFWRACGALDAPQPPAPVPALRSAPAVQRLSRVNIDDLDLLPRIPWDHEFHAHWRPGENEAIGALERFVDNRLARYAACRDQPAEHATSQLSPRLHFGEISPRQVWHTVQQCAAAHHCPGVTAGAEKFLAELGWREFAHNVLHHNPDMPDAPLDTRFSAFPWRSNAQALLRAWRWGETGFPMVDAGLRELWATGWMHNRVRMLAGSLLVKNLRIPWQEGERWFWDTLVDADLANNSLGWQWVAGSGADAAPFFRIFNPVRQGEQFDPDGAYVARWLPELAALPGPWRHAPWTAPANLLRRSGVRLGSSYPRPIVDLDESRREALAAFQRIKTPTANRDC